jgi:hypothetical protein
VASEDPVRLPVIPFGTTGDPLERDLTEVDAAIGLVATGSARRVRLVGLVRPEAVAGIGAAHAGAASVAFRLERDGGAIAVTVGPRAA